MGVVLKIVPLAINHLRLPCTTSLQSESEPLRHANQKVLNQNRLPG
jgi:hypothetical protein